jgi:signal transduction histidine kinase
MRRRWSERIEPAVRDWWPVVLVVSLNQAGWSESGWDGAGPVLPTLLGLVFALPLRWRRRQPVVAIVVISAATTVSALLVAGDPPFAAFVALLIACFALAQHAPLRVALAGLAAPVLPITTLSVLDPTVTAEELVFPAFYIGAAWGAGRLVNRRQELARRMAALAAALEQQQQENARLAADAERHRIAREVHDIVAQSLGVILIQAEAAQELLDRGGATERPVAVIRSTAGEALEELRGVLGGVRAGQPSPQVGVETLEELIERFRRAGMTISLQLDGLPEVPAAVDVAAYRLVQEALTNALRHAHGAKVAVQLSCSEDELVVQVRDDGTGSPIDGQPAGSGYGLAGMRERVARLGGELAAGPVGEGGFTVEARLPLSGAAS